MKRLMKFLLGLTLGAALAMLFAPKSGRELRQQLSGSAGSKFLPPAPDDYPMPEGERAWDAGPATAVAEPDTVAFAEPEPEVVARPWEDAGADAIPVEEVAEESPADDLRARIEETRSAIETEIAEPFAFADAEMTAAVEEPVAEEIVDEPVAEEIVEEPVAEEVVEEPVAEEIVEEPVAEEALDEPVAEEVVEEPEAAPEVFEGPVYQEPVADVEPAAEPAVEEAPQEAPRAWEVWQDEAANEEPVTEELVAEVAEEPIAESELVAEVAEEAVAEEPVADEAIAEPELLAEEPVLEEPIAEVVAEVTEEPVAAEAVAEPEPVAEVAEEAVVEEPSAEVAEEPVAEEPVAEVAEEPAAEEPAVEEPPAAREGATIDQAEMRRRIEETRARLKAKAFDAMMSGEAALLRNDSGDKPLPKGDDVDLEAEIDTTIDESFSQDED
jgi:hypothetical protein